MPRSAETAQATAAHPAPAVAAAAATPFPERSLTRIARDTGVEVRHIFRPGPDAAARLRRFKLELARLLVAAARAGAVPPDRTAPPAAKG